ncbi:MAG: hypothetical protein HYT78_18340 [Deltaproteobacteria bacterium]|nr:hypothetical protein [Deltaproteobacteria bacterium]
MTGITALGGFASLASYRPYFIGLAGLVLAYSFFIPIWRKHRSETRHVNPFAVGRDEVSLTLATAAVLLLIFFPTMEYDVAIPALLKGREAGEQVRFLLSPKGLHFAVVRIWPEEQKKKGRR